MTIPGIDPIGAFDFDGQLGGSSRIVAEVLEQLRLAGVSETTAELSLWVTSSGDDADDGLTEETAKATPDAVWALVPYLVLHNTTIHSRGVFVDKELRFSNRFIGNGVKLVVDGGDEFAVVDDNSGANYTADINSTSSIGLTTAGWTVDEFQGKMVEVLTGPAAGNVRSIQSNTADTLVPCRNFSADPGAGATFRVVRPATTIQIDGTYVTQNFEHLIGDGSFHFQRMSLLGTKQSGVFILNNSASFNMSHIVWESAINFVVLSVRDCADVLSLVTYVDPSTYATISDSISAAGLSMIGNAYSTEIRHSGVIFQAAVFQRPLSAVNSFLQVLRGSILAQGASLRRCADLRAVSPFLLTSTNYAPTRINEGLLLRGCRVSMGSGDLSGSGAHGIECLDTFLEFTGAVSGSGHSVSGVYAHTSSTVLIADGSPPTLTGTTADLSIDGTTQISTWAAIDAGTAVNGATVGNDEFVIAKEV
jgi:hypothetical protein